MSIQGYPSTKQKIFLLICPPPPPPSRQFRRPSRKIRRPLNFLYIIFWGRGIVCLIYLVYFVFVCFLGVILYINPGAVPLYIYTDHTISYYLLTISSCVTNMSEVSHSMDGWVSFTPRKKKSIQNVFCAQREHCIGINAAAFIVGGCWFLCLPHGIKPSRRSFSLFMHLVKWNSISFNYING